MRIGVRSPRDMLAALRLSPLMAIGLSGLAALAAFSALFTLRAFWAGSAPAAAPDLPWRPPNFVAEPTAPVRSAESYTETLSRPIFLRSRRPVAKATADQSPQVEAAASGLAVKAIVKTGRIDRALVSSEATQDGRWISSGEVFEGWTAQTIGKSELTLRNGQRTVRLKLYADSADEPEPRQIEIKSTQDARSTQDAKPTPPASRPRDPESKPATRQSLPPEYLEEMEDPQSPGLKLTPDKPEDSEKPPPPPPRRR